MRVSVLWLCFWLPVLALPGCGKTPPEMHIHTGTTSGVAYEVHGTGQTKESRSAKGDVELTVGSNHLQIKDGQVVANGKASGVVKDGDRLILDDKGRLFVNGEPRSLSDKQQP